MWWIVVSALQTVAGPADPAASPRKLSLRATAGGDCNAMTDEVIVCGRPDQQAFRLKAVPNGFAGDRVLPKAETTIAGKVKLAAESEAGQAIGGAPPRAMVRLKMPF